MRYLTDKERWENPEHRKIIEDAVLSQIARNEHIGFLLWSVEGTPWEEWTKIQVGQHIRAKAFIENVPRFI